MPNHVTTILKIEDDAGLELQDIRKVFVNEKGHVDLDVIKPMPSCLKDFEPHSGITARAELALGLLPDPKTLDDEDINTLAKKLHLNNALRDATTEARKEDIPEIVRAIQNYVECGYTYWYDWSRDNWGTKWNCYGQPDGGHPDGAREFEFETAWNHPAEMIHEITKRLPNVTFSVRFADEDLGSNCGAYCIKGNDMFQEELAPRYSDMSDEEKRRWTGFAFRIRYGDDEPPEAHGYDENWEYSDKLYEAYEARQKASDN